MPDRPRRIGILAGGGTLPLEFARAAAERGELVQIVAIDGAADADFAGLPAVRVGMGQVGRMLRTFHAAGATDIVIIGPARRPNLLRIVPDAGFFTSLPAILRILASGGDDGVLRGVVRFFEAKGFNVLGPAEVAPETLAPLAGLTDGAPDPDDKRDIDLGFEVIRVLGRLDVGQAAIVTGGRVEAIEGAEGTDQMLARIAIRRTRDARAGGRAGVLIKRPKPGQELRVDMPSIGPGTVTRAVEAGLKGIAVHAGDVLIAERDEVVRRANASGLFVIGADDAGADTLQPAGRLHLGSGGLRLRGRSAPSRQDAADISLAASVMSALTQYACGRVVVVSNAHVQAVEAGEEGASVLARIAELRARRSGAKRRNGVAVFDLRFSRLESDLIARAADARLAGLAVVSVATPGDLHTAVITACDAAGLFLAEIDVPLGDER